MVGELLRQPRGAGKRGAKAPSAASAHRIRQSDPDLQHLQVVLALKLHLVVFGVDLDVPGDHRHPFALEGRKVVGPGGVAFVAFVAFVRKDERTPWLDGQQEQVAARDRSAQALLRVQRCDGPLRARAAPWP